MRMLVAGAMALAATQASALTVTQDYGGRLLEYAARASHTSHVRFDGECDSACTVFMSVPDACVTPRASFGFHAPYNAGPAGDAAAKEFLLRQYPGWVRRWISDHGGLTSRHIVMDYSYARKHMRTCT